MKRAALAFVVAAMLALAVLRGLAQVTAGPGAQRSEAMRLEQAGRNAEAEALWKRLLSTNPADAEAYAHLGILEARSERYKSAIAYYRKALALQPDMPGVQLNLGLSLFKAGDFRDAIRTFQPLLKTAPGGSPEQARLVILIGLAHYGLGQYTQAVPYLKKATAYDRQNLPFRLALAQSCLWSRQYQCVLDVYHEILLLNAESAEADMLAGEAYDAMKNSAGAIEQFRAAVKADPRMPNAHFGLGYLLWTQNQFEEASREFRAELENVPSNAKAMVYLADSEMQLNHPDVALPLIQRAIRLDPSLARAHLDLGILYTDARRHQEALKELQIAVKLSPQDPNVHWRLARLYQAMGRKQEAQVEFKRTQELHKLADETVFKQLKKAQEMGKEGGGATVRAPKP